jgi:hypothetical protein
LKEIQMPATTAVAAGTYTLDTARPTIGLTHKTMWGMHRIRGIAMAVLKLDRIMTAPADVGEMLASRAALAAAVKMPLLGASNAATRQVVGAW